MRDSERRTRRPREPGSAPRPEYWAGIYQECYEEVRCFFAGYVKCPQDVEDLVQSVFIRLITHKLSPQYPHVYIRVVAKHQLCSYWRRKRRSLLTEQTMSDGCNDHDVNSARCDWESDPLEQLARRETEAIVGSMMTCLSPILAEALRLRFISGLQLDEAAVRAGCSRETLKKRLMRAKWFLLESVRGKAGDLD